MLRALSAVISIVLTSAAYAAVLPEQRADFLYHSYDGGGATIDGPSVLVRKNIGEKVSLYGNYYIDMVTSASIDVIATASEYTEERTEYSLGADYLNDRTLLSFSYTNSDESDYAADTVHFSVSQEFFGDLSTLTMGIGLGDDTVKQNGNDDFEESLDRKRFSLGVSQILTKKLLASFSYEAVIDEGFLNNPYRQARFADNSATGFNYQPENYPDTRNSDAYALRAIYSLTPQSSLRAEYRKYSDSWGVKSNNIELRYAIEYNAEWLFEVRVRQYQQDQASFYFDVVPQALSDTEFFARDKELSDYSSQQFGFSITHTHKRFLSSIFDRSETSLSWDRLTFDYDNFSDATSGAALGAEPLYTLDADVIRVNFSGWF